MNDLFYVVGKLSSVVVIGVIIYWFYEQFKLDRLKRNEHITILFHKHDVFKGLLEKFIRNNKRPDSYNYFRKRSKFDDEFDYLSHLEFSNYAIAEFKKQSLAELRQAQKNGFENAKIQKLIDEEKKFQEIKRTLVKSFKSNFDKNKILFEDAISSFRKQKHNLTEKIILDKIKESLNYNEMELLEVEHDVFNRLTGLIRKHSNNEFYFSDNFDYENAEREVERIIQERFNYSTLRFNFSTI